MKAGPNQQNFVSKYSNKQNKEIIKTIIIAAPSNNNKVKPKDIKTSIIITLSLCFRYIKKTKLKD